MKINLRSHPKNEIREVEVTVEERIPDALKGPQKLGCKFKVEQTDNYYLIELNVNAVLSVCCQRCLGDFQSIYHTSTTLAICSDEQQAAKLMKQYECILSKNYEIDLLTVLTDELYLSAPDKHEEIEDCDPLVQELLGKN